MVQDRDRIYLKHILEEIDRIDVFLADANMQDFLASDITETHYAVVRSLEIIGEAVNKLSSGLREEHSNIPWSVIIGMRNKIIHEYMSVDYEVVWETVTSDLPQLKTIVESLLQ